MSRVSIQTLIEVIFDMSKLVHFRARWYDPETGRWLSPDPIGLAGGLNLYCFCGNDPVNRTDPSGLCSELKGVAKAGVAFATSGGLLIALSGQLPPMPPQATAASIIGCWVGGGALVVIGSFLVLIGSLL